MNKQMDNCTEPNRAACPMLCIDYCNATEEMKSVDQRRLVMASSTPETDAAAYEATTRTVGKWIVPIEKARKMERERDELRALARFVASQMDADECQCVEPPDDPASERPESHSDYCPVYIAYHCRCHLPENAERIRAEAQP